MKNRRFLHFERNSILLTLLAAILTLSVLLVGCAYKTPVSDGAIPEEVLLTVSFIDVGQGDSILIQSGGHNMLVDAGTYSQGNSVVSYLSGAGVDYLDCIVATHPHTDHIGGMMQVIEHFDTGTLMCTGMETVPPAWETVLDCAEEHDVPVKLMYSGDNFTLGSSTLSVLSPAKNDIYSSANDWSAVLKLECGNASFLLMGDAEAAVERSLLNSGADISADVLKCGHHGSSSGSGDAFIAAVNPSAAVISCGTDNDYGHPHKETLDTLSKLGIRLYRTDKLSTITAFTDGKTITISSGTDTATIAAGNGTQPPSATATAGQTASAADTKYIGNKRSHIFHSPDCSGVQSMSDKNKAYFDTREDAVGNGYTPCASCKP